MLCEQFLQIRKIDIKGIWPERAHFQKLIDILDQSDLAELALIVEGEPVISGKNEQHARVRRRFLFVFEVTQRAGHAEMQAQPNIAIGAHEQMLAMTATGFETAPFQAMCKLTH